MGGAFKMSAHSIPLQNCPVTNDLKLRAVVVATAAAKSADAVDREARFPAEAFAAAREQRLLDILVPTDLGGEGASVSDVVMYVMRWAGLARRPP